MREKTLSKLVKILLILSVGIAIFIAGEILTRHILHRPGFVPFPNESSVIIVPHPTRGYAYAPNKNITKGKFCISFKTNSLGLRDLPISPGEKPEILATGNSFTAGYAVRAEDAWPAQLQLLINSSRGLSHPIRVVNAGVGAYSLTQIRILIEELIGQLKPNLVILGLYSTRYWRINNPHICVGGTLINKNTFKRAKIVEGGILYSPYKRKFLRSLDIWLKENLYLGAHILKVAYDLAHKVKYALKKVICFRKVDKPGVLSTKKLIEQQLDPLLEELETIYQITNSHNSTLVVLLVNEQSENGSFTEVNKMYNSVVKSFCKTRGIHVLDPVPVFEQLSDGTKKFRLGSDHHWSVCAHETVAQALAKFLAEKGFLESVGFRMENGRYTVGIGK